jgi:hypothetical protein
MAFFVAIAAFLFAGGRGLVVGKYFLGTHDWFSITGYLITGYLIKY